MRIKGRLERTQLTFQGSCMMVNNEAYDVVQPRTGFQYRRCLSFDVKDPAHASIDSAFYLLPVLLFG